MIDWIPNGLTINKKVRTTYVRIIVILFVLFNITKLVLLHICPPLATGISFDSNWKKSIENMHFILTVCNNNYSHMLIPVFQTKKGVNATLR